MILVDSKDPAILSVEKDDHLAANKSLQVTPFQGEQNTPIDQPPPYEVGIAMQDRPIVPMLVHASQSVRPGSMAQPNMPNPVNHISVFSRHSSITGTYLIDPSLPAPPILGKSQRRDRSIEREHARNTKRAFGIIPGLDDRSQGRTPEINAAFRTRDATISLDVGIAGRAGQGQAGRAMGRVMLSSRHGAVNVDLFKIQEGYCVDLDISTRHGNIVVLLPPTFHGPVAFRTRSGRSNIIFLPAFAERARTLRGSDRETFVHLSPSAANAEISANSQGDDYCLISTRHGKIIVGLSGIDQKPVEGDSYEVNKADTDDDTDSESN
ncbi:hypothetical protein AcV5_009020 [Taiwanofungus camphoratus]|nr:hypothetical protein AcV5_009020 [Antrodia cinnamomea]KAI0924269.1 hypothetical protein AcW2_005197 [Antrodia cinnamomea]